MRHALWLGIFATACTGSVDGGPLDEDAPPPDTVEIVVRDGDSPQAGVTVLFQNADDSLVAEVITDAAGVANAVLPAGGSVSVIRTYPAPTGPDEQPRAPEVYTYVGVRAGERLFLGAPASTYGTAQAINVLVPVGAGTLKVSARCGTGQGQPPTIAMTVRDCGAEIGLYVVDGGRSSFFKRAPYGENIDLRAETLESALQSSIIASNVPLDTTVTVETRLASDGFVFYRTDAERVDQAAASVELPPLDGVELLTITEISSGGRTRMVAERKPHALGTINVDASAGAIVSISEPKFEAPTLSWTEDGAGAPDVVLASLDVTRTGPLGTDEEFRRMIVAPYGGASLRVPGLPGLHAKYNASTDDQIGTAIGLATISGGYAAARPRAFTGASVLESVPMNGVLVLSYAGQLPGL